jgi:hypothetical protein
MHERYQENRNSRDIWEIWHGSADGPAEGQLRKYKTRLRLQYTHEVVKTKHKTTREAWGGKEAQTSTQTETRMLLKKKAARRPALKLQDKPKTTRQARGGKTKHKTTREVWGGKEAQTSTETEKRMLLKKKAGRRPALEIQDKIKTTRQTWGGKTKHETTREACAVWATSHTQHRHRTHSTHTAQHMYEHTHTQHRTHTLDIRRAIDICSQTLTTQHTQTQAHTHTHAQTQILYPSAPPIGCQVACHMRVNSWLGWQRAWHELRVGFVSGRWLGRVFVLVTF